MILGYKYRLLPTRQQHAALARMLEDQRQLYNAALQERMGAYRTTGRACGYIDQCAALTLCRRELPEMAGVPVSLQRWTLKRLDESYAAFFRRLKARRGRAGFPRFRGRDGWSTFGFREIGGCRWDGKRLRWKGLPGGLRVHLHRSLPPDADIRSLSLSRRGETWTVSFRIETTAAPPKTVKTAVGVDLGLAVFAQFSDGVVIPNPQIARRAHRGQRRWQRTLARCQRGSKRRAKVRAKLASLHRDIANTRATWLHQQSAALVKRADLIAAEDLNIAGMVRARPFARSISDAGWSTFLSMVAYKAEKAGGHFVTINPRNTSQRCSGCGELVPKSLAVRTHSCPHCGLVIDRDWNASLNILQAVAGLGQRNVGRAPRAAGNLMAPS